jgi:glycosyltransferase involved in cell wall biosynthesis
MIIINDSPEDTSYTKIEKDCLATSSIIYRKNATNRGVNYSRNVALSLVKKDAWVIFLDDDDYLAKDTLATFASLIQNNREQKWFMTNRYTKSSNTETSAPKDNTYYSYAFNYLLAKRIKGDATHCIQQNLIGTKRFSRRIKQGEEWIFFYEIGTISSIYYSNHTSTYSDGYDATLGLNFRKRSRKERACDLLALIREGFGRLIFYRPTYILYILARTVLLIK